MLNTFLYAVALVLAFFAFDMSFVHHLSAASLMVSSSAVLSIVLLLKD